MTAEEEIIRAGKARELLDNPIFKEACAKIEAGLAAQRRKVPMRESDMHTRLILTEQLWCNLLDYLSQTVQTGDFMVAEAAQRKSFLERLRSA